MPVPVYVDFDGVLNSFSRDHQRLTAKTGYGQWVNATSEHTWPTTWWEAPTDVVRHTGIDAPFAQPLELPGEPGTWKADDLANRHGAADRFVWSTYRPQGRHRARPGPGGSPRIRVRRTAASHALKMVQMAY